jgi:hypothetical protein
VSKETKNQEEFRPKALFVGMQEIQCKLMKWMQLIDVSLRLN